MLKKALKMLKDKGNYIIYVGKSDVSKMIGQKKSNIVFLENKGFNCKVKEKIGLSNLELQIVREV